MRWLLVALLFVHANLAAAQAGKLLPVDEAAEPYAESEWTRIKLRDGRTGYISSRYVRSPIDYRAVFNKMDGRWRMTAFVAGD